MVDVAGRPSRPDPANVSAVGSRGMITTSHPAATDAGLAALRAGGSAVDAYLAAAAVQTVVEPTMTTLAGNLYVTVYEPSTGESHTVAGFGELPAAQDGPLDEVVRGSGRTVLPPGWVRGAHAAWKRWGRLAWSSLFAEALSCARDGFVVDPLLWGPMFEHRRMAGRYAAGRQVWFPGGRMVGPGELLRQPALARTIEQVAEQGVDFVYHGEFARRYVDVARAAGGRITLDDMAGVEAVEMRMPSLPLADGSELRTVGPLLALMLNLVQVGELGTRGRPADDPESLYLLMRIVEESWHHGLAVPKDFEDRSRFDVPKDFHDPSRFDDLVAAMSPETAEKLWPQVESGPPRPFDAMNQGTNAIVAVDDTGMVAHGTHSSTSTAFGVGLMVDGVIVPRSMVIFADPVVPMPTGWGTSLLMLKDGQPVLAAGSPSISAVQNILQNTVNMQEWGMDPAESVSQPMFGASSYPSRRPMVEATFGDAALAELDRRGMGVTPVSPWEPEMGSCHAVRIDADGTLHGVADPRRLGRAAGV